MNKRTILIGLVGMMTGCNSFTIPFPEVIIPKVEYREDENFVQRYEATKLKLRKAVASRVISQENYDQYGKSFFDNLDRASPETQEKVLRSMDSIIESSYQTHENLKELEIIKRRDNQRLIPNYQGEIL